MNPMPLVLARIQPPIAATLMPAPTKSATRVGSSSASTPKPICATARIVNATTADRCSLCTPIAAAWMAPAPIEANAVTATAGATARVSAVAGARPKKSEATPVAMAAPQLCVGGTAAYRISGRARRAPPGGTRSSCHCLFGRMTSGLRESFPPIRRRGRTRCPRGRSSPGTAPGRRRPANRPRLPPKPTRRSRSASMSSTSTSRWTRFLTVLTSGTCWNAMRTRVADDST